VFFLLFRVTRKQNLIIFGGNFVAADGDFMVGCLSQIKNDVFVVASD